MKVYIFIIILKILFWVFTHKRRPKSHMCLLSVLICNVGVGPKSFPRDPGSFWAHPPRDFSQTEMEA